MDQDVGNINNPADNQSNPDNPGDAVQQPVERTSNNQSGLNYQAYRLPYIKPHIVKLSQDRQEAIIKAQEPSENENKEEEGAD